MGAMATSVRQQAGEHTVGRPEGARGGWPAPGAIRGRWTATDLETLPDDGLTYEIIDGLLIVSPAPNPYHQRASGRLLRTLGDGCAADREVLSAPLDWQPDGTTSLQPDLLVVWRADVTRHRLLGTPLLVVEIVSPTSRRLDRDVKFARYQEAGVPQYWIVDPGAEDREPAVEVYDLDDDGEYQLQVRATGAESAQVTGPVPTTVTPAELVE